MNSINTLKDRSHQVKYKHREINQTFCFQYYTGPRRTDRPGRLGCILGQVARQALAFPKHPAAPLPASFPPSRIRRRDASRTRRRDEFSAWFSHRSARPLCRRRHPPPSPPLSFPPPPPPQTICRRLRSRRRAPIRYLSRRKLAAPQFSRALRMAGSPSCATLMRRPMLLPWVLVGGTSSMNTSNVGGGYPTDQPLLPSVRRMIYHLVLTLRPIHCCLM